MENNNSLPSATYVSGSWLESIITFNLHDNPDSTGFVYYLTYQMRKQSFRLVKSLVECHTVSK